MQNTILISSFVKKDCYAITLYKDGQLHSKEVKKLNSEVAEYSSYSKLLYVIEMAFRLVRKFIEDNGNNYYFVFELNNSTVIKWFDKLYSKPEYEDVFKDALMILQELPIRYNFVYNNNPKAKSYLKNTSNIGKVKLQGLDF